MAKKESSPERREINQHLHRYHDAFVGSGSTLNRQVQHDGLHNGDQAAGVPLHLHPNGSIETVQEIDPA